MNESENLVPKRRFKEFTNTGTWGQRKSKEICTISTGKGNTQDKIDDGKYPFYVRSATIERSNDYLYDQEAVLTVGDGVGTGKVFHYVNGKYNLHQRVYRMFDFNNEVSAKYFYYYFSKKFYRRVMAMTAKTSVDSVRLEMIADMIIEFPSPKEQQKIVKLFESLDDAIALHQHKLDKTKSLKSAYLLEMFPAEGERKPKRRFAGFTDDWEQRKLVEELSLLKDGTHGTHIDTENGPYLLSAKNIKNGRVNITPADRKISIEEFNKIHTNFSLQAGDVLLTIVGSIGETAVLTNADNITFQRSVAYLRPKSMNSQFLYTTISGPLFQKELKNRQVVSAQPGIYLGDLAKIDITIPDIVEQTAIASFFKQLDDTIALHQHKLEKLKNIKQAYLNELFV